MRNPGDSGSLVRVLVTDASRRHAFAAIRALGPVPGVWVEAADTRRGTLARRSPHGFVSRYCRGRSFYAHPALDPSAFRADLERILVERRIDVLLPVTFRTMLAILHTESTFRAMVTIPFGSFESMSAANDKALLHRIGIDLGIPVPQTKLVRSVEEARSLGAQLPVVLKAARGAAMDAVWFIENDADWSTASKALRDRRGSWPEGERLSGSDPLLLQEFVPGDSHDACPLADRGQVRALLTQCRVVTRSVRGGPGLVIITTRIPELREYAERIVAALQYHGAAQIEFKRDTRDGSFRLLEMNGRFWGTLALSTSAGINFPLLAVQLARGEEVEEHFEYEENLEYRWMSEILLAWLQERGARRLRDLLRRPTPTMESPWQWRDPVPSFQQVAEAAYRAMRLLRRRSART